jgi:Polyketide cyclase / dehydrase and lipid transport
VSSRVHARVDIAAPPIAVFAFFDDLANASVLVPNLVEVTNVEALSTGGRRVEYATEGRDGTRHLASSEHVVYEPPHRTVTRSVQSGVATTATREFVAVPGGTRVVATIEWDVPIRYVSRLVSAPLRGPYRRALRDSLDGAATALAAR